MGLKVEELFLVSLLPFHDCSFLCFLSFCSLSFCFGTAVTLVFLNSFKGRWFFKVINWSRPSNYKSQFDISLLFRLCNSCKMALKAQRLRIFYEGRKSTGQVFMRLLCLLLFDSLFPIHCWCLGLLLMMCFMKVSFVVIRWAFLPLICQMNCYGCLVYVHGRTGLIQYAQLCNYTLAFFKNTLLF